MPTLNIGIITMNSGNLQELYGDASPALGTQLAKILMNIQVMVQQLQRLEAKLEKEYPEWSDDELICEEDFTDAQPPPSYKLKKHRRDLDE